MEYYYQNDNDTDNNDDGYVFNEHTYENADINDAMWNRHAIIASNTPAQMSHAGWLMDTKSATTELQQRNVKNVEYGHAQMGQMESRRDDGLLHRDDMQKFTIGHVEFVTDANGDSVPLHSEPHVAETRTLTPHCFQEW